MVEMEDSDESIESELEAGRSSAAESAAAAFALQDNRNQEKQLSEKDRNGKSETTGRNK